MNRQSPSDGPPGHGATSRRAFLVKIAASGGLGAAALTSRLSDAALPAAGRVDLPARSVPVLAEADVVVSGGGPAGISAACCAARHGAKVVLLERWPSVGVSIGPLQQSGGPAAISPTSIEWNFIEGIFIERNTPKLRESDLIRPAPAWFPDCLGDGRECALSKGTRKAVYLTIRIPPDAQPGECRGEVSVKAVAAEKPAACSLPLVLTVVPLTLPHERHVMATEWFSTSQFTKHHDVQSADSDRYWQMLKIYAENMADHRQNVFRVSINLVESRRAAGGASSPISFDFSRFDRFADVFWSTGRMDLLETGFVAQFGEGGWSSREIGLRSFPVLDESTGRSTSVPGEQFLPQFLPAFVAHLREKGWLEKTVFHIADEPSDHNVMAWREASRFVHHHAPELRRLDAIETPHCLGQLEIWIPKLDHLATWQDAYEEARRQGNELWFYTVGIYQKGSLPNKTVDVPLIESRLMHWLGYRFGLKGYLHWGFNAWTDDPIHAPGMHRGDGWHVYPKKDGLLNSMRWEQMRNGLEDYECLWLLEDKIARIKARLEPRVAELIQPTRRPVEIASQVVRSYADYTRDPAVLYAARRQVIDEILELDQPPRVILQTNPPEHAQMANDCAVDMYGWAEPGTTIKVNGQPVPVAADGLFLDQLSPDSEGMLRVEAENEHGHKTLVRSFRLLYGE